MLCKKGRFRIPLLTAAKNNAEEMIKAVGSRHQSSLVVVYCWVGSSHQHRLSRSLGTEQRCRWKEK